MPTAVLFVRHSVRNVPDKVELANGTITDLQAFSLQSLPLYASPTNSLIDGGLSGVGWELSAKLGKLLRKKYKHISIRASVSTNRTIDTGIAIARAANVPFIDIYNGSVDPLFFPQEVYHYELPPESLIEKQQRYTQKLTEINRVSEAVTKVFGVELPTETKITLNKITGLLGILDKFSQEPTFSMYSQIDLGINAKNRQLITQGITIRQFIDNIPVAIQQNASNLAQYILDTLLKKEEKLTVLVGNDNPISSLCALLEYQFQIDGLAEQYVNANSGLLFILEENHIRVNFLGLDVHGHYDSNEISKPIKVKKFTELIEQRVNPLYVNLSDIDNVKNWRVL